MKKLLLLIMMSVITLIIMMTLLFKKCANILLYPFKKKPELNSAPVITIQ